MRKSLKQDDGSEHDETIRGCVDVLHPNGVVEGWCVGPEGGAAPRRVMILVDRVVALRDVVCSIHREDLRAAGVGDGHHGFRAELPASLRRAGHEALVEVIDQDSKAPVGPGTRVTWDEHAAEPGLEGNIDSISDEGMMLGWAWDRTDSTRRVTLNVLADGVQVGTVVAGLYRDDLRAAGKADGHCGFSFFLPWQAISSRAEIAVMLQDSHSGVIVGPRATLRRPQFQSAEQRIEGLERQLQLVRSELQSAETRAARVEDARQAPELFKVVAAFFEDLADGKPRPALLSLSARLDEVAHRLPLVSLASSEAADTTILVLPDGNVDRLHACLNALHRAGADLKAHVALLDSGEGDGDDVALIHAAVRHLRVLRIRPDETINDVLRGIKTPYIALLPAHVEITGAWMRALGGTLRGNPRVGVAAAQLAGPAGQPLNATLVADPVHGLQAGARAASSGEVDALDSLCLHLRAELLWEVGGLNPRFATLVGKILDLCLQARQSAWHVALSPEIGGRVTQAPPSLLDQLSAEEVARLRAVCEFGTPPSEPRTEPARPNRRQLQRA